MCIFAHQIKNLDNDPQGKRMAVSLELEKRLLWS
jgi:hypothetical protein